MIEENNSCYIEGVIAEPAEKKIEIYGEWFYETKVNVERLSGTVDTIPVTIPERLVDVGSLNVGAKLYARGQFRSYQKIRNERSRLLHTVFLIEVYTEPQNGNITNDAELIGYICKPTTFRTTPFKRDISDVFVAVNRKMYKRSDYIPCITWGRNARFASELPVGSKVRLKGRIQSRIYEKKHENGETTQEVVYELSASIIELCNDDGERQCQTIK